MESIVRKLCGVWDQVMQSEVGGSFVRSLRVAIKPVRSWLRPSNQRFCDINPPSFPVITTAHSLPCLLRFWLNGIHRPPPPPGRSSRPPPAPSRGGGQCMAIVRIAVHGEETGSSGSFSPGTG